MAVKVPPMLHKMSVAAQKAWYKKNKMEYPGAVGKEGRSAAQAKKDVGEINKKKAREAAIAAAAKASKKNKALVSSSERVREMGRRRRESGEGLGGGLETNRDILSYVRAGGIIKAGRLGEAVKSVEEGVATAQKVMDRANVVAKTNPDPKKRFAASGLAQKAMLRTINPTGVNTGIVRGGGNKTYRKITGKAPPYQLKRKTGVSEETGMNKETASQKEPPFTPDKKVVRRGPGGPMSQAKWLAKQAMMKKMKELKKEEIEVVEAVKDAADVGEYDYEGDMAKSQLRSILANAKRMHDMLEDNTNLPEWVQSKITLAQDYVQTAASYMEAEMNEEVSIDEKMNLATAKMGDVIKDFQKSDAPQFAGKSKEKRRQMAIAAKLEAERGEMKEEAEPVEEKYMGFKKLAASIKAKGGARDPEAVAAAIGRKKYGKEKFQAAAAAGKKMSEALDSVFHEDEEVEQVDEMEMNWGMRTRSELKARKKAAQEAMRQAQQGQKKPEPKAPPVQKEALDPVGKEDKDIDNDGDSDKTDVYLSKRRKAIGSAIRKKVADKMGK